MPELADSFKEAQIQLDLLGFELKPHGFRSLHLVNVRQRKAEVYAEVTLSLSGKSYIYRRGRMQDKKYKTIYIPKNARCTKWVTKAFLIIAVKINKELI